MIREDYCSFEVAKLLKEKGFGIEEETRGYYPTKGDALGRLMFGTEYHHNTSQVQIAAPTHQMTMKWLRETHSIAIEPMLLSHGWFCQIEKILEDFCKEYINETDSYKTYEEAVDAALKYCLENLI